MLARRWAPSREEVRRRDETERKEKEREDPRYPPGNWRGTEGGRPRDSLGAWALISPHLHPRLLTDVDIHRWTHHERISPRRLWVSSFRRPRSLPSFLSPSWSGLEEASKFFPLMKDLWSLTYSSRYHIISSTLNDIRCIILVDRNILKVKCWIFLRIAVEAMRYIK